MKILGIETSCDETAVCILDAEGDLGSDFSFRVLGNALYSQVAVHAPYGGVYPNLAKREHAKNLVPLLKKALEQSGQLSVSEQRDSAVNGKLSTVNLEALLAREPELLEQIIPFLLQNEKPEIDAIAVTVGPGLEPALWVGINFARALSAAWEIPIVAVNHMEGHIVLSTMEFVSTESSNIPQNIRMSGALRRIEFPMLALLVSGGHTELVLSREWMRYERIGETRDDAAGEAFDKVARLLDLPYPGGPEISRLAAEARTIDRGVTSVNAEVTPRSIRFTRPMLKDDNYDFSFSGLKTAVRKVVEENAPLNDELKMQIAREFEETVADVLISKTLRAIEEFGIHTIIVGGGVSANAFIRSELARRLEDLGTPAALLVPPADLATDNAIMIALAGYFRARNKEFAKPDEMRAVGNLRLP